MLDKKPNEEEITALVGKSLYERLVKEYADRQGVTEQLKSDNQLEWVQKINNIRNRAMEIVYTNLIYA